MDMRYNMPMQDGRNPYGSRGGYVVSSRGRRSSRRSGRRDRGMPMHEDMRRDMNYTGGRGGYPMGMRDYGDMRGGDYAQNQNYNMDMRNDYTSGSMGDMARRNDYGYDGHYPMQGHQGQGSTYYPIEAMGVFNGYYGMPEQDYGYDMRSRGGYGRGRGRDYGYDDYGNDYGDYGETLSDEELEKWNKKLLSQLTEQEKQMFSKEMIMQRAKSMGKPMDGFGEKELYTATLMVFTDYKQSIGANPDLAVKLAYDWLADKDVEVKGAEKLAVYYDEIVMGGEDD